MSENQEPIQEVGGVETMFQPQPTAPVAEEPIAEEPTNVVEEPVQEEVVEEPQEKQPNTEEVAVEPTLDDQGRVVVSLDDDSEDVVKDDAWVEQRAALLAEIESLKNNSKLDPRIQKMNEYVNSGGEITSAFWELQSKDYSKINIKEPSQALTALRDKLQYLDGMDRDEADFYIEKNFPISGGFDSDAEDDEIRAESMKLRMEVKSSLPKLKDYQDKVRLPDVDNNRREQDEKNLNMYRAHSSSKLDEIKSFDISLDADTTLNIPYTGAAEQFTRSVITEPENQAKFFGNRYRTESGDLDYGRFKRDLYEMENRDKIYAAIYAQGQSAGKKSILSEIQPEAQTQQKPRPSGGDKYEGVRNMKFR